MQKVCNLCNTLSKEEAASTCAHDNCPHKAETKQVFIELTAQDLIDSPELVEQGYKAGDKLFADNAGNTHVVKDATLDGPPEPHLPAPGIVPAHHEGIAGAIGSWDPNNPPAQGDPGDEQPQPSKSIIGKIADFITGK